ncbi:MAG TPA: tetratricopeptide repeat protein, partial [Candidatus Kapabacteria bacterium]|nr:tetratricopeptide repeat protein [Candidatus Kapabacteria bacterium]
MLTNKNWALKAFSTIRWVIAVCGVFLLVGCQPPGPKSLLLGQKYLEQGNYDKALKYLTRASELIPAHPQVWNHLGLAYHAVNEPAKASDAYQRAIRIDRNLPAPHYNLGTLLLEQQHLPQALSELSAFVTLQTNSAAGWTKLGTALVRLNRPDDAERALAQALRIDPRDAEAYNSLGLAHIQRKRPREAMLAFNSALQHREGYPAALLNQAIIAHQHFGNKQLALDRYKAYLTTKPDPKSAAQVQLTVASIEKELSGVEVAQAAPPAPEEASPFSNFLRTNSNSKTAEAATNKPVAAPVTNAVAARQTKTNPPVVANLATNRPLAIAAATN